MLVTATLYRSAFTFAAGYLLAAIAPQPKMRYVVILGVIGTILGLAGVWVVVKYDLGPMWYPIALVVLGFPCTYFGGILRTKRGPLTCKK